jgi:hypothetical protein
MGYNGIMTIRAKFDGRVFVPEGPVELPIGTVMELSSEPAKHPGQEPSGTLADLVEFAEGLPANPDARTDGAAQHDHYLYGAPKRP